MMKVSADDSLSGLSIAWSIVSIIYGTKFIGFLLDSDHARTLVIWMPLYFILWLGVIMAGHKIIRIAYDWLMSRFNDIP